MPKTKKRTTSRVMQGTKPWPAGPSVIPPPKSMDRLNQQFASHHRLRSAALNYGAAILIGDQAVVTAAYDKLEAAARGFVETNPK